MFEAGAISKQLDQSLVCPILVGLDNSDIKGPLTQFQTTLFEKGEFRKLVSDINKANKDNSLESQVLDTVFEKFWPELEERIAGILEVAGTSSDKNVDLRPDREIIEEILDLSRALAIQKSGGFKPHKELNNLISEFLVSFSLVFDLDWDHTKMCIEESKFYIDSDGSFLNPGVEDEENNWANRARLLDSYRNLIRYIKDHNIDIQTQF
jgi:hypothetical protein